MCREDPRDVGPQTVKGRVTQGYLPRVTEEHVKADGDDGVDPDDDENVQVVVIGDNGRQSQGGDPEDQESEVG
jgi:hypothetical protein